MPQLKSVQSEKTYEYQILLDSRVVWTGKNPEVQLEKLSQKYPKAKIGIRFVPQEGVLIAEINFQI